MTGHCVNYRHEVKSCYSINTLHVTSKVSIGGKRARGGGGVECNFLNVVTCYDHAHYSIT